MPIVELSNWLILVLDIMAWTLIHLGVSLFTLLLPEKTFYSKGRLYKLRSWEMQGGFWKRKLHVHRWKYIIPDGASLFKKGFKKKKLNEVSIEYLKKFEMETRRAELTHWLCIPPAFLFFLWNPIWAGWIMVLYACLFNFPIIVLQRYNRGRLRRILILKDTKNVELE
ncbi:hypothetical conserved protein [Oceanobacillus iheyensis HTE831]|uniref:Glycosyl-4,4'-diaponeurosporenoate acyltransferase n=1 Tax=Oceanobacillus iheyensis (strain DSM 14371 / CIP 107618 / JCM 11309 / KCTC 3954 / HTE831) TaxID=221109 RepID=Q8ENM4_OCEIH|nr:hypothetical protein [Oceanobacillus iheyensis]BAC14413.1 hypothetical conserved protein [Oceanobacillus iheyensis HTE831]